MNDPWTLQARWVLPADREPIANGTVTIQDDRIVAVEPPGRARVDMNLGQAAVLPGFVNAHTHLDLTGLQGRCPPSPDFTSWLQQVIAHRRSLTAGQIQEDIARGLEECICIGTTLIGDIAGQGLSWDALANAPVRATVYHEALGLPSERATAAWQQVTTWQTTHPSTATCRPAVSPHAPYSVRDSLFFGLASLRIPVCTHLAETRAEMQLLQDKVGPFAAFLKGLGVWDPDGLAQGTDHVLRCLQGKQPVVIAHGNYLADTPIPDNATIVYCPRTHAAFGHDPHPFREMLSRGLRVALGTDSLASNPDLHILAEARFVYRQHPEFPGHTLLRMLTLNGAVALGWDEETGSITPGKSADLVALPLEKELNDPYQAVFSSQAEVQSVLFRGQWTTGIKEACGQPLSQRSKF